MAQYIEPIIIPAIPPALLGKHPYMSMNNGFFHGNISFQLFYLFTATPARLLHTNWISLNLSKEIIEIMEISYTTEYMIYFENAANDPILFSDINLKFPYGKIWAACGIGSRDCSAVSVPATYDLQPFYECNYFTQETFFNQYQSYYRSTPISYNVFNTASNFINVAIKCEIPNDGAAPYYDLTNWINQVNVDYANYLEANSELEGFFIAIRFHICGKYKQ